MAAPHQPKGRAGMTRLLAIPVAGTIAAIIVVLLAHEPREEEPGTVFPEPPPALPDDVPDAPVPDEGEKAEEKPAPKRTPPPPRPAEHFLRLEKDGSLVDLGNSRTFAHTAAVIAELAKDERVRNRIILSNGAGVEDAALDKIVESLSAKFVVRKVYRAPKKEE
jgi:hypothetical protein